MNSVHWHLLLNHIPIMAIPFGAVLLLSGITLNSTVLKRAGFVTLILGSISFMPAFRTGKPAEEIAEHIAGVTKHMIHEHEELAEKAQILVILLGIASLIALFLYKKERSVNKYIGIAIFAASIVTSVLLFQVGNSGGAIRHSELNQKEGEHEEKGEGHEESEKDREHND